MAKWLIFSKDFLSLSISILIGLFASILVLIYTLNLTAAILILVFTISAAIFQISFSNGWLFILLLIMLFPSMAISSDGEVVLMDLLLALIALVGLIGFAVEKVKIVFNRMFLAFFLFSFLALSLIIAGKIFEQPINKEIALLAVQSLLVLITLLTFQYYFQTLKRLRRFFIFIVLAGLGHSIFGLVMFFGAWQTFSGMGISSIKITHFLFQEVSYAINGFFGLGLEERLGGNALVPFLMVSIPVTVGLLLTRPIPQSAREKKEVVSHSPYILDLPKHANNLHARINLLSDVIRIARKPVSYEHLGHKIRAIIFHPRNLLITALIIQVLAFSLTFSYVGILFMGIGFFAMGIILRDRRIITVVIIALIFFSVVIPNFRTSGAWQTMAIFSQWQEGFNHLGKNWILGNSGKILAQTQVTPIKSGSSFLYIWNNLGLAGFILLLFMLINYFRDIYRSYKKSEGEKRVWLVVIVTVFINLTLEAFLTNTLFFGPAALVFWLLYITSLNLRERRIMFGLIDSKIFK